jgi:crotonobetainyl-CoA:carnitine CoA-transferase CaiB-like acyl-CoA transferase
VLIAANGDSIFKRLCRAMGRADLANDASLAHNDGRAARQAWLDEEIEAWTATRGPAEILAAREAADVPASKIYTIADIAADPHYAARQMIRQMKLTDGSTLKVPASCRSCRQRPAISTAAVPRWASTRMPCCGTWATTPRPSPTFGVAA